MTTLPPELETLIDHARDGHGPDPQAKARVRAALATSIVAGAAVATTTATAKGLSPMVLGLLLAGGGVTAVSVAAVTLEWGAPSTPAQTAPAPKPARTIEPATPRVDPAITVTPTPTPATTPSDAPVATTPPHASHPARTAHHPAPPTDDPVSTLARELELVRSATAAVNQQRWADALDALDQHAARFAQGALAQERAGLRALCLCQLGRADGPTAAARFIRSYPDSPMIERLRASCPGLP
jgi:hypothetical protein